MTIKRYGIEGGTGTGGQKLPFARAVEADGWLYISGQTPMREGEVVGEMWQGATALPASAEAGQACRPWPPR